MKKKYIIELEDENVLTYAMSERLAINTRLGDAKGYLNTMIPLAPYTAPDLEQVRKEAYEKGYENGFIAGHLKAEKSGQKFYEDGYQRGLADAWEAARKIQDTGGNLSWWIHNVTAPEAIEKIRQYEQRQEKIKIGDEVENIQTGVKFTVTHLWENNRGEQGVSGFSQECSAFSATLSLVVKTGRHFPEVAAIFDKMREN